MSKEIKILINSCCNAYTIFSSGFMGICFPKCIICGETPKGYSVATVKAERIGKEFKVDEEEK